MLNFLYRNTIGKVMDMAKSAFSILVALILAEIFSPLLIAAYIGVSALVAFIVFKLLGSG